jgi:cytochrome c oxidase cbb3-type subunit 3
MIKNGKTNVMPAQSPKLSADQIHVVAAYVLSIGGLPPLSAAPAAK